MNDILNEYISTGKTPNEILKDKIKANNKQWFLILILFIIIFGGYAGMVTQRNTKLLNENSKYDSTIFYKDCEIEMMQIHLDSAVYFRDIIVK